MNKLTAEVARRELSSLKRYLGSETSWLSLREERYLQALEIALPVLERQDHESVIAEQLEVVRDSLALNPHQYAIISCAINRLNNHARSLLNQQDGDGWIEWRDGECPVAENTPVAVKYRNGVIMPAQSADCYEWNHDGWGGDIIAYRVIEQQEREQGEQE